MATKGEETRQRIIEKAAPLFNQRGYEGCSMQDIMHATGLEKGGIYRHFQSKEELAAEAFDFAWETTRSKRRTSLSSIANPLDRLKQNIANFVLHSGFPGGCPLLNTAVDSDNGNPILRRKVRKALAAWKESLQALIEEGIAAGAIRKEVDPRQVVNVVIATLEGGMLISRIEQTDKGLRGALAHLNWYVETALRRREIVQ
ncbi:TetR/AcrR family transcriptional regulator [Silvibacterium acidisoli]|uniref:TetR/AcrR family transcriptional regulator n=1 Tax=Acidobacteriaceae bacterium ZG23-2 TaxID=2883246 RepID=UPI00406BFEB7